MAPAAVTHHGATDWHESCFSSRMRPYGNGFSLVEYVIALTMVAIAALCIAPLYYKLGDDYRVSARTNDLVTALRYARGQAIARGQAVSICSSDDGSRCTSGSWGRGYLVFVDGGDSGGPARVIGAVLQARSVRGSAVTISTERADVLTFTPVGMVSAAGMTEKGAWQTIATWVVRLSPIATAQAQPTDYAAAGISFRVCGHNTGRVVSLSSLGAVKTTVANCRRK